MFLKEEKKRCQKLVVFCAKLMSNFVLESFIFFLASRDNQSTRDFAKNQAAVHSRGREGSQGGGGGGGGEIRTGLPDGKKAHLLCSRSQKSFFYEKT